MAGRNAETSDDASERGPGGDRRIPAAPDAAAAAIDLRAILENSPAVIYVKDTEGRYLLVNRRFEELFPIDRAAVLGRTDHELFPGDLADRFRENDRQAAAGGQAIEAEEVVPQDDGLHTYISLKFPLRDDEGRIFAVCGISSDITERKRTEEELRYLTTHVRCLLWHGTVTKRDEPPGLLDWDTQVFDEAAARAFMPLQMEPGERYTQAWWRHRLPEGRALTDRLSAQALREGLAEYAAEFGCRGETGEVRWFSERVFVQRIAPRKAWRLVGVCTDITERKRGEDRLQAAYEKERRVAEALQQSLLLAPPPDAFPGITVKPLYEPAWSDLLIGGDFFDVFAVAEDRVALVVGDATGKGLAAATYTAEVKFALRAFLREHAQPAVALERLNSFIAATDRLDPARRGHSYVSMAVAVVDTKTGELACSAAGMEPPFLLRAATGEVVELSAGGLLLGVEERAPYGIDTASLEPGDLLVMTTDGITEARAEGTGRRFFGYAGLVETVREAAPRLATLADIGEAVMQRVRAFAGPRQRDDVCLLLARRL